MILGGTLSGAVFSRPVGSGGVAETHPSPVGADSGPEQAWQLPPVWLTERRWKGEGGGGGGSKRKLCQAASAV